MEEANATGSITIEVVDIFSLLRNGYLGCSPLMPTVALSLRTLSLYREIHRTCPRLSLEAMAKTLCYLQNVPYHQYLRNQFMASFDAYLEIRQRVKQKLDEVLGYNSGNRLSRACPACFKRVPGEQEQEFSVLLSIDGNNSLKRISASIRGTQEMPDSRSIQSDRWITSHEVDQFKDEVLNTKEAAADNFADEIAPSAQQSTNADGSRFDCIDRWKNAGPATRKRMFSLFDETGIFIACCRHRMVVYGCDMKKSGELAKYPLAIVNRMLLEMGNNIGCAYDIGCEFSKMVVKSSLGKRAADQNLQFMVGAFHGHAHKRSCQLSWHPLYIKGTGRTEGEGCEHIFSSSNDLARNTRHASRFHRLQAIDEHFNFWDEDKYALLSTFIANHYKDAIKMIRSLEQDLDLIKAQLQMSDEDLVGILDEEKQYLGNLLQPPIDVQLKTEYIPRNLFTAAATPNLHWAVSQARHRVDLMALKMEAAQGQVLTLEEKLQITERWTTSSADYKRYYAENVETEYQKTLDELERLVVMRVFEFNKVNEPGLGYKLREHIWGALQRRSEAVRNAIKRYNVQAERFDPPRRLFPLDQVPKCSSSFLAEFDILRFAQPVVQGQEWVRPACREASIKYYKLCRAREEVKRLNLEARRLQVSINDETTHTLNVLEELSTQNPILAIELKRRQSSRSSINNVHLRKLTELRNQVYFTGMRWDDFDFGAKGAEIDKDADGVESESEGEREFDAMTEFIEGITD
ncbi:hypothetical protein F5887DRAFT_1064156 [Amanita rubescens]|nr:hypothetical protein F5887DRAFT_1064156 [Amanita rubescens]